MMMKKNIIKTGRVYVLLVLLVVIQNVSFSQNVGINATGSTPDNSAGLDVDFTNKGLLIPRVALTETGDVVTITGAATSLLVYNTATAGTSPNDVIPGYYYWNGIIWVKFLNTQTNDWSLTGNAGTTVGTNFLGTTDANDFAIYTNNIEAIRVTVASDVGIGTITPTHRLTVNGNSRVFREAKFTQSIVETYSSLPNARASFTGRRARGTVAVPSYPLLGDGLVSFVGGDAIDNNSFPSGMYITAAENFTATTKGTNLFFETALNGTTNGLNRMIIKDNGLVGISTTVPTQTLSVNGTAGKTGGGVWAAFSDKRLKQNINDYTEGIELLKKIHLVSYQYNKKYIELFGDNKEIKEGKFFHGVIAQELQKISPDMVNEITLPNGEFYFQVDLSKLNITLINAVVSQQKEIDEQFLLIKGLIKKVEVLELKTR